VTAASGASEACTEQLLCFATAVIATTTAAATATAATTIATVAAAPIARQ
jgi:hypothetical protein